MKKTTVVLQDTKLTQGEKLMILVFRTKKRGLTVPEIAAGIGVSITYLPALYEKENLTMKVIQNASSFFGVPPEYFEEDTTLREVLQRLNTIEKDNQSRIAENRELREEIIILKAQIIQLRREKGDEEKHIKHN